MKYRKAVVAGGSGFMGQSFLDFATDIFEEIVVLTRGRNREDGIVRYVHWDGKHPEGWTEEIEEATLLLNLSGKSVDCRYTEKNKKEILNSRIDSTTALGTAVIMARNPPVLWINIASATVYRHAEDHPMTEENGELGTGFSVEVCKKWETTFWDIPCPNTRKIALRTAMVLGKKGGVLNTLAKMTKAGLGGQHASGKQMISWIHEFDFARIIMFLLASERLEGTFNASSPQPANDRKFMCAMRQATGVSLGLPTSKWLIGLGALILRTESELILKSRWVLPAKLLEEGFVFQFESIESALEEIFHPDRVSINNQSSALI